MLELGGGGGTDSWVTRHVPRRQRENLETDSVNDKKPIASKGEGKTEGFYLESCLSPFVAAISRCLKLSIL
jgi:hypothetical protein